MSLTFADASLAVLIASVIVMVILVVVFLFHRLPESIAWMKFVVSESGLIAVIGILAGIGLKYSEHFEVRLFSRGPRWHSVLLLDMVVVAIDFRRV